MSETHDITSQNDFKELAKDILVTLKALTPRAAEEGLLDFPQTCRLLNVKESKLRKMVFEKSIPFKKVGRNLRFDRKEIGEWLALNSN
jgi:excisionase family DNA binding protein